jgi:hypothetical protein
MLNKAGIRRAIDELIPLEREPVTMVVAWEDTWSLSGNRTVQAKFRCGLCRSTHQVILEQKDDELDPADWWKGEL